MILHSYTTARLDVSGEHRSLFELVGYILHTIFALVEGSEMSRALALGTVAEESSGL